MGFGVFVAMSGDGRTEEKATAIASSCKQVVVLGIVEAGSLNFHNLTFKQTWGGGFNDPLVSTSTLLGQEWEPFMLTLGAHVSAIIQIGRPKHTFCPLTQSLSQ